MGAVNQFTKGEHVAEAACMLPSAVADVAAWTGGKVAHLKLVGTYKIDMPDDTTLMVPLGWWLVRGPKGEYSQCSTAQFFEEFTPFPSTPDAA